MERSEKIEGDTGNREFESFASQALRLRRRGSFENLLCQHLIMSVAADPMTKVRLICEAGWMVNPNKIGLDLNQVETIYTVALGFLNTNPEVDFLSMAWGFTLSIKNYSARAQSRRVLPHDSRIKPVFVKLSHVEVRVSTLGTPLGYGDFREAEQACSTRPIQGNAANHERRDC